MTRARLHSRLMLAGWLLVGVWVVVAAVGMVAYTPVKSDWTIYFDTARALRTSAQVDLWRASTTVWGGQQPGACPDWGIAYVYPPLLAIVLAPLTSLSCGAATSVWHIIALLFALVSPVLLVALGQRFPSARDGWTLAAFVLVLTYLPLLQGVALGQVHLIVLCSCLGGVLLAERGHDTWGGIMLSAGFWLKYVPGVVVLYYLLTGRWRVALGAALGGLALLLAQLAVVGPRSMLENFGVALEQSAGPAWGGMFAAGLAWHTLQLTVIGAFVVGVVWTSRGAAKGDELLGTGWALASLLLVSPVIHWFYVTWLLPTFWVCLRALIARLRCADAPGGKALTYVLLSALGVSFVLSLLSFLLTTVLSIATLWLVAGALYLASGRVGEARDAQPATGSRRATEAVNLAVAVSKPE